jgi:hypothetical protein
VSGRFDHVGLTVADPEGNLIELLDRTTPNNQGENS